MNSNEWLLCSHYLGHHAILLEEKQKLHWKLINGILLHFLDVMCIRCAMVFFYKNLNLEISIPLSKYFDLSVNTFVKTLKHQYH